MTERTRYFRSVANDISFYCSISCEENILDLVVKSLAPYFIEIPATIELKRKIVFHKPSLKNDNENDIAIMTDDRGYKIYWNPRKIGYIRHARREGNVTYIFENNEVEIATDLGDKVNVRLIARTVYITFIIYCRSLGFRHLHCSAAEYHNKTYLFLGESQAGKTTFLLSCLARQWNLVSNDQVILLSTPQNIQVAGLPISANIRKKTVEMFPDLVATYGVTEVLLPIISLAEHFRSIIKPVSPLGGIVILRRNEGLNTALIKINDKEISKQLIRHHEFRIASEHQPFWAESQPATQLNVDSVPLFLGFYQDQKHIQLIEAIENYNQNLIKSHI